MSRAVKQERLCPLCIVSLALSAVCLGLSLAFRFSQPFAELFNQAVSAPLRCLLAAVTTPIPFSLAECLLLLTPVFLFLLIRHAVRYHAHSWRAVGRYTLEVISLVCVLFILFTLTFGAPYFTASIDSQDKLDLDRRELSTEDLFHSSMYLAEQVSKQAPLVLFEHQDFSHMPYSYRTLNDKLNAAYETFCEQYPFVDSFYSYAKPVMLSEPMSYTHITGVYSFFTGEANVNVNFPDYTLPFTAAHELAHQRGIAREDEANFIAYLVCISSEDAYIRYSGYLNMFEYVSSALYQADKELYYEVRSALPVAVRYELNAYSNFFDRYRDSTAGQISSTVNDSYLKLQGTEGTRSYGLVVDLAVAYDKKNGHY